jgi:hypothetical protein
MNMAKLKEEKWTLVQHSGFGYGEKPGWENAVETRQITTEAELGKIINIGGLVFDSYEAADKREYEENYPGGAEIPGKEFRLTYPEVKGTFSDKELDGLKIYIPVREVVG